MMRWVRRHGMHYLQFPLLSGLRAWNMAFFCAFMMITGHHPGHSTWDWDAGSAMRGYGNAGAGRPTFWEWKPWYSPARCMVPM